MVDEEELKELVKALLDKLIETCTPLVQSTMQACGESESAIESALLELQSKLAVVDVDKLAKEMRAIMDTDGDGHLSVQEVLTQYQEVLMCHQRPLHITTVE